MTVLEIKRVLCINVNKNLSLCWQTRATRLEVSQDHHTWYHSIC